MTDAELETLRAQIPALSDALCAARRAERATYEQPDKEIQRLARVAACDAQDDHDRAWTPISAELSRRAAAASKRNMRAYERSAY